MKMQPKQILSKYFNSWWLPPLAFLVALAGFTIAAILRWRPLSILADALIVVLGILLFGVLLSSVWNLIKKRWAKGIVNLVMLPVCVIATVFALGFLMVASMLGPSEDGFADDLAIPDNIEAAEPRDELNAEPGKPEDPPR